MANGARNPGSHGILIAIAAIVILILAAAALGLIAYVMLNPGDSEQPIVETKPTIQSTTKATATTKAATRATTKATTKTTVPGTGISSSLRDSSTTQDTTAGVEATTTEATAKTTTTTTTTIKTSDTELGECIVSKNIFLYTSSDLDCEKCVEIEHELNEVFENGHLDLLFCNEPEDQQDCEENNIDEYPTWEYNDQKYEGYSLDEIRQVVDC